MAKAKKTAARKKMVYYFGDGKADGNGSMRNLVGGKGANLAEMSRIGIPVPAGFTITTEVCSYYYAHGEKYPRELAKQVPQCVAPRGSEPVHEATLLVCHELPL